MKLFTRHLKLTQLELKLQQSLQLQEIKLSLQSLERTIKVLSEKSDKRSTDADVIDVDSLLSSLSSNPPPSESSCTSAFLPPAFDSPPVFGSPPAFGFPQAFRSPPVFGPTSPSSNFQPTIPSLSGKQMAPPTSRYFQPDCRGGASCWGDSCPQSGGVLELEGGIPSTRGDTLVSSDRDYTAVSWSATTGSQLFNQGATPQLRDGTSTQDMLDQQVEFEPPTQGARLIPARLVNKFTPISPTKYKSSDKVITLY